MSYPAEESLMPSEAARQDHQIEFEAEIQRVLDQDESGIGTIMRLYESIEPIYAAAATASSGSGQTIYSSTTS